MLLEIVINLVSAMIITLPLNQTLKTWSLLLPTFQALSPGRSVVAIQGEAQREAIINLFFHGPFYLI